MNDKIVYLIDLLIIPLIIFAYYQSLKLTATLNLNIIYFFFILFMLIHVFSSILSLLSNYFVYGEFNRSMILTGFGPTIMAFLTLLLVSLLPFIKWPFYLFKWIPYFDSWITPFLMGLSAFITQVLIRKTISETINNVNLQIENIKKNTEAVASPISNTTPIKQPVLIEDTNLLPTDSIKK